MTRILVITISALLLAGCAGTTDTYNRSAMPNAASGLQLETVFCKARWTAKEFTTYSEWQACQLTAERSFARAIALTRMDAFDVYAAGMQALAVDRDANRVTDRQVRSRANDIYTRFLADCGCKPQRQPGTTIGFDYAYGGALAILPQMITCRVAIFASHTNASPLCANSGHSRIANGYLIASSRVWTVAAFFLAVATSFDAMPSAAADMAF